MVSSITTYGSMSGKANYLTIYMTNNTTSSRLEFIAKIISSQRVVLPISINEHLGFSAVSSTYTITSTTSGDPLLIIYFYLFKDSL